MERPNPNGGDRRRGSNSNINNRSNNINANNVNRPNASNIMGNNTSVSRKNRNSQPSSFIGKLRKKNERIELIRYREGVDRWFLILVITMLCLGTVMIFSASYVYALQYFNDSYYFAKRQILMAALGIVVMIFMSYAADYLFIKKITVPFFFGVLVLNYLTPFFGKVTNGAPRWFRIAGFQFQPSELLKVAVVFLFAYYITTVGDRMKTFFGGILIPGGIIVLITGAMFLQSHFSGLIIIALICIAMIFIGEAPWKWLAGFGAIGALGVFSIIMFTSYAKSRVDTWLHPEANLQDGGWQITQSLYAIGSGGLTGLGWGQSRQKYLYLPEPQNDFIFSIVCEELGFIGAILVMALFVLLIWRGFVIAYHAPDKFSAFVVMGIMVKVAVQFILNLAVVTNTIPNTGIPLPFFSYGGTALVVLMMEMGIILSISRYSYQDKP
ncbi:MAG: putative lipid II flippase FtsW [Oscillospiraceae bacterium]|nr:putative lipid II flippase FtsW [Oscillospiraceae bacterium]